MSEYRIKKEKMDALADTARALTESTEELTIDEIISKLGEVTGGNTDIEDGIITKTISGLYSNDRVPSIGAAIFSGCSNLTDVSFPNCMDIGSFAFSSCSNLSNANFPKCTTVGNNAFQYCSSLTTASFPECESVGNGAFQHCSSLSNVSFSKCSYIGSNAFQNCSNLKDMYFPICSTIGSTAFRSCKGLVEASFPKCESIGSAAFSSCSSLTKVDFSECINIGSMAFLNCTNLTDVSFPKCEVINTSAFHGCESLTTASFPKCKNIYNTTFNFCSSLTTASFPECSYIGSSAFISCSNLKDIYFPACISMGMNAFSSCSSLTTADFPVCTSLSYNVFYYCSNLTTASFPKCTDIGSNAFFGCYNLSDIYFPECVNIGGSAFRNTNLTTASFPKCLSIASYAFDYCSNLTSLYLTGSSMCKIMGSNVFKGAGITSSTGNIFVPFSLVCIYKGNAIWSHYSNIITSKENFYVEDVKDLYVLRNETNNKSLVLTLKDGASIPSVDIISSNSTIVSVANSQITAESIIFDITSYNVVGNADITITVDDGSDVQVRTLKVNVCETLPTLSYNVESVSGATDTFILNDNDFYESQNKGKGVSYAICKVNIIAERDCTMYVDCINYAEANRDYGILSKLDKTLNLNSSADTINVEKTFKGSSSSSIQTVSYDIPLGEHFIYIKFIKDKSGNTGNDSLQFKIRLE